MTIYGQAGMTDKDVAYILTNCRFSKSRNFSLPFPTLIMLSFLREEKVPGEILKKSVKNWGITSRKLPRP